MLDKEVNIIMYNSRGIKKTYLKIDANKQLDHYFKDLLSVRIEDKDKDRFTDVNVSIAIRNGRVKLLLVHEKGYPSEDLGLIEKLMTLRWVSNKLPKI